MSRAKRSEISSVVALIGAGTMAWIVAAVIALAIGAEAKIIWTCVFGAALGAFGIRYSIRHNKRSGI